MSKIEIELRNQLEENISVHKDLLEMSKDIIDVIQNIHKKLKKGGKILFCGNGGSAADAQHLAAEFIVRLRPHVNRNPIPALTLAQDTSTLTACGNDYSFEDIFLRPFKALVKKNDILICITTSGNSKNILKVLEEAKKTKIYSVCFLGKSGGKARKI
ncbi:SIS domain-containing protein, partial [Pelagibacteraceae bacterium]|nr:SIS domain-containing protein [Pelagibacteraceae bacterium]